MATEVLLPTGPGTYTQLTSDPPSSNWSCMRASDDDYVYVYQNEGSDTYQMANSAIPAEAIISKVVVTVSDLYTDGGGKVFFGLYMSGNTYGSLLTAITGATQTYEFLVDPVTSGAWSKTAINNAELAVYLYAPSGKVAIAGVIYATVHYTLPSGRAQVRVIGMML